MNQSIAMFGLISKLAGNSINAYAEKGKGITIRGARKPVEDVYPTELILRTVQLLLRKNSALVTGKPIQLLVLSIKAL